MSPAGSSGGTDPDPDTELAAHAREHLLAEHRAFLSAVLSRADRLDGPDADALRAALDCDGLLDRAPGVLAATVDAIGRDLPHEPVAEPPYVVVTSAGLILRAAFGDDRLVVTLAAFERRDGEWIRHTAPEAALRVERRTQ